MSLCSRPEIFQDDSDGGQSALSPEDANENVRIPWIINPDPQCFARQLSFVVREAIVEAAWLPAVSRRGWGPGVHSVARAPMPRKSIHAFFNRIRPFRDFRSIVDRNIYVAAPETAVLALTDVVNSTEAVQAGQYKSVNFAGAAAISALANALDGLDFPFVFGGDGASAVLDEGEQDAIVHALATTAAFARDELGIDLRAAIVPVRDIRQAGFDVTIARYQLSPHVAIATLSGGGLRWADEQMKRDRYAVQPAASGAKPDLTGLSCRWKPIASRAGVIVSLVAQAAPGVPTARFGGAVSALLHLLEASGRSTKPMPEGGPEFGWPAPGLDLEVKAVHDGRDPKKVRRGLQLYTFLGWFLFKTRLRFGKFNPGHYRRVTGLNSDHQKFDDGLKMTLDCSAALADEIEVLLERERMAGTLNYGMHRQSEAIMTCIVPSVTKDDHIHFLDGAGGGYALAAAAMKRALADR